VKITDLRVHVANPDDETIIEGSRLGWVFVEVETDEGVVGVGECSNWPRRGNLIVANALHAVRGTVLGRDPVRIEQLWIELFNSFTYLGNRGVISTILSGLDIALWDIRGQVLGQPVYDLIGGRVRDAVPLYTHPDGRDPDEAAANARALVDEGYVALKTDPFVELYPRHTSYLDGEISAQGLADGVEIVSAIRAAVGPRVDFMIDMHGQFNVPVALEVIAALEPFGIKWFEEPVPPGSLDAYRLIRRQTNAPLCAGERMYTRWDVAPFLQEGLISHVMPDVCWTGGISELKKIAAMAETSFIPVSPHNALGPVQIIAGGHVALTIPNLYRLEINSRWADRYNLALTDPLPLANGMLHLSGQPGLGLTLDPDFLEDRADPEWREALGRSARG
jgi:galactonate dehydratase